MLIAYVFLSAFELAICRGKLTHIAQITLAHACPPGKCMCASGCQVWHAKCETCTLGFLLTLP